MPLRQKESRLSPDVDSSAPICISIPYAAAGAFNPGTAYMASAAAMIAASVDKPLNSRLNHVGKSFRPGSRWEAINIPHIEVVQASCPLLRCASDASCCLC